MINIDEVKKTIVKQLKPLNPVKVILFGSYIYGEPTEDSDLDICVIENNITSKIKEKSKIRKALSDIKIAKDILVEDEKYFYEHSNKKWINTALYDARHKGVVIYEQK
jgi:predicted nucleotidyltransferase